MPITGMSTLATRAGDNRVLTSHACGYANDEAVGLYLSPLVEVQDRTGIRVEFDDSRYEQFNDDRAPGGDFNIIQAGYEGKTYTVKNKGLAFKVPTEYQEEAEKVSISFGLVAQDALSNAESLKIEVEQMQVATNTANYGTLTSALSGTSQFSDPASRPGQTVSSLCAQVARACGRRPNLIISGYDVTESLRWNADVRSQFQYTSSASITEEMLARYFSVDHYKTGRMVWRNPATGQTEFIWGKFMILAYVNPAAVRSGRLPYSANSQINRITQPSRFYTYVLKDRPSISNPFWWEMSESWFYKIKFERTHEVTGINAGYLIRNAVA